VTPVTAQADRASWQRQAAAELARILEGHPELPCIAWTVGPASSVLIGQVSGLAPAQQLRESLFPQLAVPASECGARARLPPNGARSRAGR
jgi:hypothetical protein